MVLNNQLQNNLRIKQKNILDFSGITTGMCLTFQAAGNL